MTSLRMTYLSLHTYLQKQVAEQTVIEVENANSKVKLKWGGSEARNRRRLPASDDVATLVQHVS